MSRKIRRAIDSATFSVRWPTSTPCVCYPSANSRRQMRRMIVTVRVAARGDIPAGPRLSKTRLGSTATPVVCQPRCSAQPTASRRCSARQRKPVKQSRGYKIEFRTISRPEDPVSATRERVRNPCSGAASASWRTASGREVARVRPGRVGVGRTTRRNPHTSCRKYGWIRRDVIIV
jgi:hypothetical protein